MELLAHALDDLLPSLDHHLAGVGLGARPEELDEHVARLEHLVGGGDVHDGGWLVGSGAESRQAERDRDQSRGGGTN